MRNTFYSNQAPLGPRPFYEKPAILRRLTAPPPSKGRGLWQYGVQHWRRNCNFCKAGSLHRWQSCIGLPSRAKLALRRTAMEQHCHSYPRTPFAASRRSPQGETRKLEALSFCLLDRNRAGRSPEDRPENEKCFILKSGPMGPRLFYEKPALSSGA